MNYSGIKMQKHTSLRDGECPNCFSNHGPILERLCDWDWREAFVYATEFTREDVKLILSAEEGENDGYAWIGLFLLKDGRFAALNAWCDYTGWD